MLLTVLGQTILMLGLAPVLCSVAATAEPMNVVVISLDTLRADQLGVYVPSKQQFSPNIDRFASESVVFQNAYSNSAETLSSHMSLFTGLHPFHHKIRNVNEPPWVVWGKSEAVDLRLKSVQSLDPRFSTLTEHLKGAGFHTAWFAHSLDPFLDHSLGFGRGMMESNPLGLDSKEGAGRVVDWIKGNHQRPFFLFVHSKVPHLPYTAILRKEYRGFLAKEGRVPSEDPVNQLDPYKLGALLAKKYSLPTWDHKLAFLFESGACIIPQGALRKPGRRIEDKIFCRGVGILHDFSRLQYLYDVNIVYADELFGQVIDALKSLGLYDKSIVILSSDHGEGLGEHQAFDHGNTLYQELLRVPLIAHFPGTPAHRVATPVQSVDILPTLLDALKISNSSACDGKSLMSEVRGETREAVIPNIFAEGMHKGQLAQTVISKQWKLIVSANGEQELYDLSSDAAERRNQAPTQPKLVYQLRGLLTGVQLGH